MKALLILFSSLVLSTTSYAVGIGFSDPQPPEERLSFDFGDVPVGETYATLFELSAPEDQDMNITQIVIAGDMYDAATDCGEVLPMGESCQIEVYFTPQVAGNHMGELNITTDVGNFFVGLVGNGVTPTTLGSPQE